MAIVSVTSQSSGWESQQSATSVRARRVLVVQVDAPATDTPEAILASSQIPQIGDPHPTIAGLSVTSVRVAITGQHTREVVVEHQTPPGATGGEFDVDPLVAPAQVRDTSTQTTERVDVDINGEPIANVNGEPFADEPVDLIFDRQITVSQAVAFTDAQVAAFYAAFIGKINSDAIFGLAPGQCIVSSISFDDTGTKTGAGVPIRTLTVGISARLAKAQDVATAESWWIRLEHRGFLESDGTAGQNLKRILDANGEPAPNPSFIDTVTGQKSSTKQFKVFQTKGTAAYSGMGLRLI